MRDIYTKIQHLLDIMENIAMKYFSFIKGHSIVHLLISMFILTLVIFLCTNPILISAIVVLSASTYFEKQYDAKVYKQTYREIKYDTIFSFSSIVIGMYSCMILL